MTQPSADDDALNDARQRIDALDQQIQALVNERAGVAVQVAEIKQRQGRTDFYRPEREAQVLARVAERNAGPLPDQAMARIVREIMSACLALEQPMTVAYLGPEGTYTQAAVYKHFGHAVAASPHAAINDIFRDVEAGNAHFGVVPVENSTEGVVSHTLDQLVGSALIICGEVALPVHHHLLSHERDISCIKRVVAHAQSLAQCRNWLDSHMPGVVREAVSSNGEAARRVAGDVGHVGVAPGIEQRAAEEVTLHGRRHERVGIHLRRCSARVELGVTPPESQLLLLHISELWGLDHGLPDACRADEWNSVPFLSIFPY